MKSIVGVEDIFKNAGYTRRSKDFLSFPEGDKKKPDRELLAMLATEILLAREECLAASEGQIRLLMDNDQSPMHSPMVPDPNPYPQSTGFSHDSMLSLREYSIQPTVLPSQRVEPGSHQQQQQQKQYQQQQQQYQQQQQTSPVPSSPVSGSSPSNPPIAKPRNRSLKKKRSDSTNR